jgi:hypothetical protein
LVLRLNKPRRFPEHHFILAGGGYKHAGHIAHDKQNNAFLSNLYVRMLQQTGIELDKFGASTGVLSGI